MKEKFYTHDMRCVFVTFKVQHQSSKSRMYMDTYDWLLEPSLWPLH
jgi:hypothetical protein